MLIAVVLAVSLLPTSSNPSTFAQAHSSFTVEIDSSIGGNISVKLTNTMNPAETKTESVKDGIAVFSDFVDPGSTYNISVTGMNEYEDYHETGLLIDGTSVSFAAGDFTALNTGGKTAGENTVLELDTIVVSGQITNERGIPYTGGGTVSYSGYGSGSVELSGTGSFSATIYKDMAYNFTLTPADSKYNAVNLGPVNSPVNISDLNAQLTVKTFTITTTSGENGTITPSLSAIPYGSSRSVSATADPDYLIAAFIVDGVPVPEAVGQKTFSHRFPGITDHHTVDVTYALETFEITFTFNADGTVEDDLCTAISSGGQIIADEGSSPSFTATANENYHISSVFIDSYPQSDGTFDNTQTSYLYTFQNIRKDHTVTIMFSINTYDIHISYEGSGTVSINGSPAGSVQNVSHGESLELIVTPVEGYDVREIILDNTPDDSYELLDEGGAYSYVLDSIESGHTVKVKFDAIEVIPGVGSDYYDISTQRLISGYPIIVPGNPDKNIYNFIYNGAEAKFTPKLPYTGIRINGPGRDVVINGYGNYLSKRFTDSVLIKTIEVYKPINPGKGWQEVPLAQPIQIIIDKNAPVVADIAPMDWTNEDYTVRGTVTDEDTVAKPSSGLSRIVWSETELTDSEVLSETINTEPITSGTYSFTISGEQDDKTYYVYAVDEATNVSAAKTVNVKIDKMKPEITEFEFKMPVPPSASQIIHSLTFGTFSNDEIEVVVSAKDEGVSSGLNDITLYSDGNVVETKSAYRSSATFRLTLDDFNNSVISASAKDKVGNMGVTRKPTEVTTNVLSDRVVLKAEKPDISIVPTSTALYFDGGEKWYSGNVGFNIDISTESVGIYSVSIKVNGRTIRIDKNGKAINANFSSSQTLLETFLINTDSNAADGENVIEVTAVNNCGNRVTVSEKIYIDRTNPKIVEFSIDKENDDNLSKVLNFLTFGNYFNEQVRVTVVADDRYGATSGVSTITLYADGEEIDNSPKSATEVGDGTYKAEFVLPESVLPEEKLFDAYLSAVAEDNVTNITGKNRLNPQGVPELPTAVNSDLKSNRFVIETVSPVILISSVEAVHTDSDGKKWYPDDIQFTVSVQDLDSGIRSVQIKINGEEIISDVDGKTVNADFYNSRTPQLDFKINTNQGTRAADGSYLLEITVVDNAGNEHSAHDIVYKDIDKPTITGYRFVPATSDGIGETSEFIEHVEYGLYFKAEFTAIIQVSDQRPSSGLEKVEYRLVSYQNGEMTGETKGTQAIVDGMAAISIPKGFKGQIFVTATDNTGNTSAEKTTKSFVVDDTKPEISVTNNNSTSYKDANDNKLYTSDMSFTVVVADYGSGIKEIGYSQSAEKGSFARKKITLNNTGYSVGDVLEDGWTVVEMDFNLVTKLKKTFGFSTDDNDITLFFDATDHSGNREENIQSEKITIDKTSPIINVSFRGGEGKNTYYYNANRIADITVTERNFDSRLIIATIENDFGSVPSVSFTKVSNTEHVAVITFDEGDYTFDVTGTDLGDHKANVKFSGGNENMFFVDKTSPAVDENFSIFTKSETDNSFNEDQTATIRVVEHNFAPELVELKINMKDAGEDHTSDGLFDNSFEIISSDQWMSSGDVHTISFTISQDAVYQIEITAIDLAENSSDRRNTVVFEIDKTAPIVTAKNGAAVKEDDTEFLDLYLYSRKDEPKPTVEFDDLNIDHINYSLTVYTPDYTSSEAVTVINPVKVHLDGDTDKSGKIDGSIFTLPNFAQDGIYALELIAVDVAGNESLLNLNTYARMIEHDVLAYILDSNLDRNTGIYSFQYENGDPISKKPDSFSDIEIFVLSKKDTGIDIVLRDNNGEEINTNSESDTDNSIYGVDMHNFTLESDFFKENFQEDTDIELHLTVKNEDNRVDLGEMHIDNIAPTCNIPGEFDSWRWYYGDEERTITVSDISELVNKEQCKVYDNGEEVAFEYSSDSNSLVFTLGEGWHSVGIVLDDMAGNTNNIQEKTNIHIGFFWLWVILTASLILLAVVIIVVIYSIRKKHRFDYD